MTRQEKLSAISMKIKQFFCFKHTSKLDLSNPTGKDIYDTYGGPMDEYKTQCNKCGKYFYFFF